MRKNLRDLKEKENWSMLNKNYLPIRKLSLNWRKMKRNQVKFKLRKSRSSRNLSQNSQKKLKIIPVIQLKMMQNQLRRSLKSLRNLRKI